MGYVKPGFDHQKKAVTPLHLSPMILAGQSPGFIANLMYSTISYYLSLPLFLCTCIYIYIYIYRDGFIRAINIRTVSVSLTNSLASKKKSGNHSYGMSKLQRDLRACWLRWQNEVLLYPQVNKKQKAHILVAICIVNLSSQNLQ